ncbi:hypothetical protein F5Y16DRAFT_422909 [Xylariaceae sp. FL0255]|nr:hypothetical protein F5Y16DRAFT_422909 [Xylariaceae sp. FL0255]
MSSITSKTTPPPPHSNSSPRSSRSSSSPSSPRPLDQIRAETKAAHRAPHLRKGNQVRPDSIDVLDNVGLPGAVYHHEGPYDAALASRNRDERTAPLAAVKDSNREALRATPVVNVVDAITRHVPLQGTATLPPGEEDYSREGRVMRYEEGADVMREGGGIGGAYRRYDHVTYHPDDLKGKGEPSYTIELAMKDGESHKPKHA